MGKGGCCCWCWWGILHLVLPGAFWSFNFHPRNSQQEVESEWRAGLAGRGWQRREQQPAGGRLPAAAGTCKQSRCVALLHILVECISSPSMVENAPHTPHASKYLLGPLSKYRRSFGAASNLPDRN